MDPQPAPPSFSLPITGLDAIGGSPLYVTVEDALLVTVFNGAAGVSVTISGRLLAFGEKHPKPFKTTFTPSTNRAASQLRIGLGDGWLLNAQAIVSAGTPVTGQTFARLSLCRGLTSVADELATLCADNITASQATSWPNGPLDNSLDGQGALRSVTGTDPAAGAECSDTVPTGARWRLHAWNVNLVTSAAVANRSVGFTIDDGANILFQTGDGFTQPASLTVRHVFGEGLGNFGNPGVAVNGMLPTFLPLLGGWRIRTATQAIDAGDNYGAPQMLVEEWMEAS
ncbi:MAG TPA: hypothetical protein VJN96_09155 [Vicinamibacterales bacterium]|nr:hypothetical protein [Vicinamibacterales bacterium]